MRFSLQSFGAAQEVTGSCHLLTVGEQQVLLDCGLHQGHDSIQRLRSERFGFDPRRLDAVVLSHAHLDHSGLLPVLIRKGFRGPIYCTPATRNLLAIMLEDAAKIYFRDLEHANLRRKRSGRKEQTAEYGLDDVLQVLKQCMPVPLHQAQTVSSSVSLKFFDAGHILGSAIVELCLGAPDNVKRLIFSGDLGNANSVLMRTPEVPEKADLVLLESTYGNRDHRPPQETLDQFERVLEQARNDKGVVLMPAFSVGRTQELLFHLGCFFHQGKLPGWQVFLDSPMAIEVTRLYDQWLDALAEPEKAALQHYKADTLEKFLPTLSLTPEVEDSMHINRIDSGAIIIAGSGMCNGGRIRHHLKHRLWKSNTHIIFAGYQARGTLGRQLVDGDTHVRMFGQRFAVKAQVHTLGGFSAHAGRTQLLAWATAIGGDPAFRLVHGEQEALTSLAHELGQRGREVAIAEPLNKVEFD